jgi:4-hydroxymandelate synthase
VRVDVVELWVGELRRTIDVLARFGFEPGATTPAHELAILRSGDVTLVLRQGPPSSAVARHVARHGDGVGDVALVAGDIEALSARARAHGLTVDVDDDRTRIDLLGDGTIAHSVRSRSLVASPGSTSALRAIDHVTYCLPWGVMARVAHLYQQVFAMDVISNDDFAEVGDLARGMRSVVLRARGGFTVVLTEPRSEVSAGQTQRFVQAHGGAGVQHVAICCDDLVETADLLHARGVGFLAIPPDHLEGSYRRLSDRALPWDALRKRGILVDADANGLLFQLFTSALVERTGFFFELVQRAGSTGFGATNVPALFAAVDATMPDRVEVSR